MQFISMAQLAQDVLLWHRQLPLYSFDCIYGIPRSGQMVAALLSEYTGIPVGQGKRMLLVDDSSLTGRTMKKWEAELSPYKTAAVYTKPGKEGRVDFCYRALPTPRLFEWQLFRHPILRKCLIDIDGLLCRDPDPEEDYEAFMEKVEPIVVPQVRMGGIVTGRLARYRRQTKAWLNKWGFRYGKLHMRPTKRMRHKDFKGALYSSSHTRLLIESSHRQAKQIAVMTGLPVLSWEKREIVHV